MALDDEEEYQEAMEMLESGLDLVNDNQERKKHKESVLGLLERLHREWGGNLQVDAAGWSIHHKVGEVLTSVRNRMVAMDEGEVWGSVRSGQTASEHHQQDGVVSSTPPSHACLTPSSNSVTTTTTTTAD